MEKLEKFRLLGLSDNLLKSLKDKGIEVPSPIQEKTIPIILNSKSDLVGQAQTGTGKTAAFGLPIIDLISEKSKKVQVIILAPTRELAMQISEELNSLKGHKKIHIVPIYGGQSYDQQLRKLSSGVDIIVGTPGRVIDMLNKKAMNLESISYLVLDEADEMLNMGFIDEVEEILKLTNPEKRTFMFCATMPKEILILAKKYLNEFEVVKIESQQNTTDLTDQIYFEVEEYDKFEALCRIIDIENDFYGLIFCRTKLDVDNVTNRLSDRGYDAESIHGDLSQAQREKVLSKFKNKKSNILVATDVAARGIDIVNLSHVINYALPYDAESYVHRVGRTGRAGNEGTAITFVTRKESRYLMQIQRYSKTDIRRGKIPGVTEIINAKKEWIKNEVNSLTNENIDKIYKSLAKDFLVDAQPEDVLAALLKYTFKNELDVSSYKEIREVRERRDSRDSRDGRDSRDSRGDSRGDFRDSRDNRQVEITEQTRLFIALGKKDGMTRKSIVQLIKDKAKTFDEKINDVQVFDTFSFITVPFREAEIILKVFKNDRPGKRPMIEKAGDRKPRN
jgi:ATP-dependent RNA helicase DeaD